MKIKYKKIHIILQEITTMKGLSVILCLQFVCVDLSEYIVV